MIVTPTVKTAEQESVPESGEQERGKLHCSQTQEQ